MRAIFLLYLCSGLIFLQSINGWYQLLDEIKGQESFHQVPLTISRYEGAPQGDPGKRSFAVTLVRSERGYGFSVDGHSPVFISQVLPGEDVWSTY